MEADNDVMMLAAAPGCTAAATHMSNFVASSMEQDNETDWDSEPDKLTQKFRPVGMSNQEHWGEADFDMGDHLACADKPPTVEYGRIEGANGRAKAPAITTHPPDPTHLCRPESSPYTKDDVDVEGLTHEEGDADDIIAAEQGYDHPKEQQVESDGCNIIVEEEYYEQQEEEFDYEDDVLTEKHEQVADVDESEVKQAAIWGQLGEPVDDRTSTDTKTGDTANLMESVLGIQSPEGGCEADERGIIQHSHHSNRKHTILSDDSRRSCGYSFDSYQSSSWLTNSKSSKC